MPERAKAVCTMPGCSALVLSGRCEKHRPGRASVQLQLPRLSPSRRGYTAAWYRVTALWREADKSRQWCVECLKQGIYEPGPITDHIIPHRGDQKLFWDPTNWQSLCRHCHSAKTAREDGGFGNSRLPPPGRALDQAGPGS